MAPKRLSAAQESHVIEVLAARFSANMYRHKNVRWDNVFARLEANPTKLWSLDQMEATGGEPDVIGYDRKSGFVTFCDCSPESPAGRRSLCYDRDALESRKKHKPKDNALDVAAAIGIDILTEDQYRALQKIEPFDLKTSSWIYTPPEIRALGGALFCDRRYDTVFVYHNGAESYYAARGFRGTLCV